jgi:hypothetical protein
MLSALLLAALASFQTPEPPEPPPPSDRPDQRPTEQDPRPADAEAERAKPQPEEPPLEEWDDRTAKTAVRAFEKAVKGRDVSLKDRLDAVESLAKGANDKLPKPLAKLMLEDDSVLVCTRAAEVLARQPVDAAKPVVVQLLAHRKFAKMPAVQERLVRALAKLDYTSRDWRHLDGLFEQSYEPERAGLQQAILDLVTEHRELQAIDLLVDNIGEPAPENPADPANPPAEYWEARWKCWETWRESVPAALLAITGQRFTTKPEARMWLEKNRDRLEAERQREERGR